MTSFKDLLAKTQQLIKDTREIYTKTKPVLIRFFKSVHLFAKQAYVFTTKVVLKTYIFLKNIHRKVHVWKILSVRYQWYPSKKGNFYNPKINASISPSWECTWNLKRNDEQYNGLESKEKAQNIAFKLWMKRRLLQKRLNQHNTDTRVPIRFTTKIILNPKILPNKIQLRSANPGDTPDLLSLMEQIGSQKNDQGMYNRIRTYLEKTNHYILVATKGKAIVGFIAFVIYDLFLLDGKRCRIEGMVIDTNQHDLTVKRRLMQGAELFARDNEGKVIDLIDSTCRAKDGTYDFYKFLGYNSEGSMTKVYLKKEL